MTGQTQPTPEINLTEADRLKIREISQKINLENQANVLYYGTAEQQSLAKVSDRLLKLVQNDNSDEVSRRMNDLVNELRRFSDVKERRGLLGWLFRKNDLKKLRKKYADISEQSDRIAIELENHRNRLLRDFVMLGKLYDAVLEHYRELTVSVEAGQQKYDSDTAADTSIRESFGKRLHDLKLSRMVCMQMLTQIRILQECITALSEKIQSLLTNTLALWKNQMSMALSAQNTADSISGLKKAGSEITAILEDVCSAEENCFDESAELCNIIKTDSENHTSNEK